MILEEVAQTLVEISNKKKNNTLGKIDFVWSKGMDRPPHLQLIPPTTNSTTTTKQQKIDNPGDDQRRANGRDGKQPKLLHLQFIRQRCVGRQDEVVQQDQR